MTVLIYGFVLVFAQTKAIKVYERSDTSHETTVNVDEIARDEVYSLKDIEANFAFGLWSNDLTKVHNMSEIVDYVQFQAALENFELNPEKGYIKTIEILPMHPCTDQDEFYEPLPRFSGTTSLAKSLA